MKNKIYTLFLVLALVFIIGCSTNKPQTSLGTIQNPQGDVAVEQNIQQNQNTQPSSSGLSSNQQGQSSNPQSYDIEIKSFSFTPSTLTIKKGDSVTWKNEDSAPHTIDSDSGTELNSLTLSNGQTYSHTFNTVGTFAYHCNVHPSMKATITVTE